MVSVPGNTIQSFSSELDKAILYASQNPSKENYLQLSLLFYEAGKFDQCIKAADEALKMDPQYDLAYNNICAAHIALKQWNEAIAAGEKAIKINPENVRAKNNLVYAKQMLSASN
jgi:tetratricopeptide (TPR) repeat protein